MMRIELLRRLLPLTVLVAGAIQAPAATVVVRQVTLATPYLWQYLSVDRQTGDYVDEYGSMNVDVDGDGADDIGFVKGGTQELLVLTSFDGEILVKRLIPPSGASGTAARFDAGSMIGPTSINSRYTYYSVSPYTSYYYPPTREELGEYYDNYDTPLPRDVLVTGSMSAGAYDLWKGRSGYLGFRLRKDDGWHYGWVYVEKDPQLTVIGGYVTAFAYETEPNKAILALIPEPSAMLLSLGGSMLLFRRMRCRSSVAES